ncbi:MAG: MotA/TolQ/ExbB proton channel family protein [Pirellulaceae bacterium]|nr:MotA/TolQ/ExbB proton channel family protein [Pirellulaceae bacterium]
MLRNEDSRRRTTPWVSGLAVLLLAGFLVFRPYAWAQPPSEEAAGPSATPVEPEPAAADDQPVAPSAPVTPPSSLFDIGNAFSLAVAGGMWMVPIIGMSLLMVTFAIERGLALRRSRLMPDELVSQLGQLSSGQGGFDPRQAYRLCQQFPCAASSVMRAMLVKVGRPHSEVEHAVSEAAEREAERAYANVRWLNLCTSVTPLMGLLGTVWGMILAFYQTTLLNPGQDRATQLAQGIYVALVTTLGGLMVAIPSAMLAHFYETRIIALFHEIDEMLFNIMPLVERYEGRVRFGPRMGDQPSGLEPPP